MSSVVAAHWHNYRCATSGDRADRQASASVDWARHVVDGAVRGQDATVVPMLVALAEAASDDEVRLAYLGAGPIEDLVNSVRADERPHLLDELDAAVRRNLAFQRALAGVWWSSQADETVAERLRRFEASP
jgi:hypothetical protein